MILQILADAGEIVDDLDAHLRQVGLRTDARLQQHEGRPDGAGGQHDLPSTVGGVDLTADAVLDAGAAITFHHQAVYHRVRHNVEVGAAHRGRQVRVSCAHPPPVGDREVTPAGAFIEASADVGRSRVGLRPTMAEALASPSGDPRVAVCA